MPRLSSATLADAVTAFADLRLDRAVCDRGINLRTAKPTAEKLRKAILAVLSDDSYRQRARALQAQCAQHDAVAEISEMLEQLATEHATPPRDTDPSTPTPSRHPIGKAAQ